MGRVMQPRQLRPWGEVKPVSVAHEPTEIKIESAPPDSHSRLQTMQEMERYMIETALRDSGGSKRKAAKSLKISERTLYRKIKEYKLPF